MCYCHLHQVEVRVSAGSAKKRKERDDQSTNHMVIPFIILELPKAQKIRTSELKNIIVLVNLKLFSVYIYYLTMSLITLCKKQD